MPIEKTNFDLFVIWSCSVFWAKTVILPLSKNIFWLLKPSSTENLCLVDSSLPIAEEVWVGIGKKLKAVSVWRSHSFSHSWTSIVKVKSIDSVRRNLTFDKILLDSPFISFGSVSNWSWRFLSFISLLVIWIRPSILFPTKADKKPYFVPSFASSYEAVAEKNGSFKSAKSEASFVV